MKFPIWHNGNGSNGNGGRHTGPEAPTIILETDPDVGPSDGSNKKYHRPPARYDSGDWDAGWTDGRLGQPADTKEKLLLAAAALERQEEIRRKRDERAAAQARATALGGHLESLNDKLRDLRGHHRDLASRRDRHGSESSVPLALMYLIFGIVLFLADVPLSLTLVAEGFDIPTRVRVPGTNTVVLVSQIFRNPLLVLEHLWEAVFLALGIAFMGIIVKFFVDAVVLRDEDDPPRTKAATAGISAAFALFLFCTWCLGQFRAGVRLAQLQTTQPGAQLVPYENWAFVLLTLAFPIAGGLCFSAGWRKLERAKAYYFASRRLRRLEESQRQVLADYSAAVERVNVLDETLGPAGDGLAVSRAELQKNVYLHGYYRGLNVPETRDADESLYSLCEKTLSRVLARKVRRNLQNI